MKNNCIIILILLLVASCNRTQELKPDPLFTAVPAAHSNISFNGHHVNGPISGGGVAIGDINNDGLPDIFFAGDSVNALYLNKGNMVFEDITEKAGLGGKLWSNGVAMGDINNDGLLDIVVTREKDDPFSSTKTGFQDTLNVLVYLNNGNMTFSEQAIPLGITTQGPLRHAVFLDYDNDGFLDIYMNANFNSKLKSSALQNVPDVAPQNFYPDFLFHSDSGRHFKNVIESSGIKFKTKFRYGFTPYAVDINQDGWTDLYLNNDFDIPDDLYLNKNGKFSRAPSNVLMQTSFYTMGVDVADINNDALPDIMTVDMRAKNNYRQKTSWWETPYDWYKLLADKDKELVKQQVKNVLQLNMGNGTFSQISELAGIDATEWSWSPLIADFDNDGWKDIFISNGNTIDHAFNIDLAYEIDSIKRVNPKFDNEAYFKFIHTRPEDSIFISYIYKNNRDLTFTNMQKEWGLNIPCNSNGAAYADLDNDGDLDIVVNNNGSPSFIYENHANTQLHKHYLRVQPIDERHHPVEGATATIFHGGKKQFFILQPVKGFLSCSERVMHFGTDTLTKVDSLIVKWPDGMQQLLTNVKCDQTLKVFHKDANIKNTAKPQTTPLLARVRGIGLDHKHDEDGFIDFSVDPLLPRMYSKDGPAIAKGDLNGDGLEDIIVGGSVGKNRGCFLQSKDGSFKRVSNAITKDIQHTDGAIAIFDANNDGYNDVYITCGGYEFADTSAHMHHRFYLNDHGKFTLRNDLIPDIKVSSECVTVCDYNKDGFPDLFVGGRVQSQKYPAVPASYLLKNDHGKFIDVTQTDAPNVSHIGMVTDAVWADIDNDGWKDLVIVGEWMPVTFIKNESGHLKDITANINMGQKTNGFWNCIVSADVNKDGKVDLILGNLGLNTRFKATQSKPLEMYAYDFDHNGSVDIIEGNYEGDKLYPIKQLRTLTPRINGLAKKYYKTGMYGSATISDIFGDENLKNAMHMTAYQTASCILENDGKDSFTLKLLPVEAQFAPVNGILADDVDGDGNTDLLLVGNFYYPEVERGRYDSFKGAYLKGDGKGNFRAVSIPESGFVVDGDARKIVKLEIEKQQALYVSSQNNDSLVVYKVSRR